jgi:hypothetical protein
MCSSRSSVSEDDLMGPSMAVCRVFPRRWAIRVTRDIVAQQFGTKIIVAQRHMNTLVQQLEPRSLLEHIVAQQ